MVSRFLRSPLLIIAIISAAGLMCGCGSGNKGPAAESGVETATVVGVDVCVNCHPNQKAEWEGSRHANNNSLPTYQETVALCLTCHDPVGDGQRVVVFLPGTNPRPTNGCESCHGGGSLHWGLGPIAMYRLAATTSASAQFNTCTGCHQLLDANGNKVTPFHSDDPRNIVDTHFGTPGVWPGGSGANTKDITGYRVEALNEKACSNCHNPHSADITVNLQWTSSRHADKTAAGAWAHYNWSRTDRAACQKCHTTSGIIAKATADANKTPYTPPLAQNDNWIPEMLMCQGCHTNNKGGLRNPGPVTADYTSADFTFPELNISNICMECHTARESGETIKNLTADFSNRNFVNSHYLTAGGTLFTVTGYEYAGRSYTNVPFFAHDKIGLNDFEGTGLKGPCVSCHMAFNTNGAKHTFLPIGVERNDPDNPKKITKVTDIRSTLCEVCHAGEHELTVAEFEEQKTLLQEAMEAFDVQLQQRGYFFAPQNPYFFKQPGGQGGSVTNWLSSGDTDTTGNTTGRNNMGAAFNFNTIEHDPGAFVHNRFYVKRLIYDSIDWLDDNLLNDSVQATLNAPPHAGSSYQAGAKAYILSAAGGRP
jgi:hypothetical protein